MSISLRLVIVLACVAGLSAAQIFNSCPSVSSANALYGSASANCSAYTTCAQARCTCLGGSSYTAATDSCSGITTSGKTCTTAAPCQAQFISCLNTASNTASCLSSLKIAVMSVSAGTAYNGSTLQTACQASTCGILNSSIGSNCTLSTSVYPTVCTTPSVNNGNVSTPVPSSLAYTADMTLGGDWTVILANGTAINVTLTACSNDWNARIPNYGIVCYKMRAGSAIISFSANVAANDAAFNAAVTQAVAAGTSWLTSTKAAFFANGGTGNFTLIGVTATNNGNTTTPSPTKGAASTAYTMAFGLAALLALVIA